MKKKIKRQVAKIGKPQNAKLRKQQADNDADDMGGSVPPAAQSSAGLMGLRNVDYRKNR